MQCFTECFFNSGKCMKKHFNKAVFYKFIIATNYIPKRD